MRLGLRASFQEAQYGFNVVSFGNTYEVWGICSNPDGSVMCADSYYSTRRSTDYGKTWGAITPNPLYTYSDYDVFTFFVKYVNGNFHNGGWSDIYGSWMYQSDTGSDGDWSLWQFGADSYPYGLAYGSYSGGRYLIATGSAYIYYYTTFGSGSATAVNVGFGQYDCAFGNSTYVVVGTSGNIKYSSDCATWTAASTPSFGTSAIYGVNYADKFLACGAGGKIAYSSDGNTWTQASSTGLTGNVYDIIGIPVAGTSAPYIYYACGASGKVIWSYDADVWYSVPSVGFGTSNINRITYNPVNIVIAGAGGKIGYARR